MKEIKRKPESRDKTSRHALDDRKICFNVFKSHGEKQSEQEERIHFIHFSWLAAAFHRLQPRRVLLYVHNKYRKFSSVGTLSDSVVVGIASDVPFVNWRVDRDGSRCRLTIV